MWAGRSLGIQTGQAGRYNQNPVRRGVMASVRVKIVKALYARDPEAAEDTEGSWFLFFWLQSMQDLSPPTRD